MLMADKFIFTSESILDIKFTKDVKGYDAYQVDQTLDKIIIDYKVYERRNKEMSDYIRQLETDTQKQIDEINGLKVENARLNNRLKGLNQESDIQTNRNNIDLLKRIRTLETFLYKKGIDPTKIK